MGIVFDFFRSEMRVINTSRLLGMFQLRRNLHLNWSRSCTKTTWVVPVYVYCESALCELNQAFRGMGVLSGSFFCLRKLLRSESNLEVRCEVGNDFGCLGIRASRAGIIRDATMWIYSGVGETIPDNTSSERLVPIWWIAAVAFSVAAVWLCRKTEGSS